MQHSTTQASTTVVMANGRANGSVPTMASPGASSAQSASTTPAAAPPDQTKAQERENLRNIIAQWNANRLDLFEISEPNEVSQSGED